MVNFSQIRNTRLCLLQYTAEIELKSPWLRNFNRDQRCVCV